MNPSSGHAAPPALDSNIRFVPRYLSNHHLGSHSGYERLFEHMRMPAARSAWAQRLGGWIPRGLAWRLWMLRPQRTQEAGLQAEIGAAPWVAGGRGRLCHFIYGEDTYLFTPLWKGARNKCVATFHYPPDFIVERFNPGPLPLLDAVILVGENQRSYFQRFLPEDRIHYCPHAVDTEFFSPAPEGTPAPAGPLRLICVGQMFRNYDVLADVHQALLAQGLDIETHVVGPARLREARIGALPRVVIHSGISDEDLRDAYRAATVAVLPLDDSTANNALLEMMSSGLPVVTHAVGGVPAYVEGSAVRLFGRDDLAGFVDSVAKLLRDPARRRLEGAANRAHCERSLSLPAVAEQLRGIYRRVLAQ